MLTCMSHRESDPCAAWTDNIKLVKIRVLTACARRAGENAQDDPSICSVSPESRF